MINDIKHSYNNEWYNDSVGISYPLNVSRDCSLLVDAGGGRRMLSVTGTVFLPGGPSSFTIRSLKEHHTQKMTVLKKQKQMHTIEQYTSLFWNVNLQISPFIATLTELMSLSVSIVPLNRKKRFFTTSSLEERVGGGGNNPSCS